MKYTILYTYDWITLGCDCCTDVVCELSIYDEHDRAVNFTDSGFAPYLENENQLKGYISREYPEYNNFTIHEDTRFA